MKYQKLLVFILLKLCLTQTVFAQAVHDNRRRTPPRAGLAEGAIAETLAVHAWGLRPGSDGGLLDRLPVLPHPGVVALSGTRPGAV